jgi:hypothetical protein
LPHPSLKTKKTAWSIFLLEKLTVSKLVKKFPAFYGPRRFIITFTRSGHLFLSLATSIQSIFEFHVLKSILISSFHLPLGLPSGLVPSGFPTKFTLLINAVNPLVLISDKPYFVDSKVYW